MTNAEMLKMRAEGATLQEIADKAGCSRQSVDDVVKRLAKHVLEGRRGKSLYTSEIKFQGFYEHFQNNPKESLNSFSIKVFGGHNSAAYTRLRDLITGKGDPYFAFSQIKKMCEIIGKPFEEVFKEREGE